MDASPKPVHAPGVPVLAYTLLEPALESATASVPPERRSRGGGALSVSRDAERELRAAMPGPVSLLRPEHVPMLRRLAESPVDADLKLVVAALEAHGAVVVRFV